MKEKNATGTPELNRRSFLKGAGAAGAALFAAPYFIPSTAFGANERIVMGIIGAGGRGRSVLSELQSGGAAFSAVCDLFEPNAQKGLEIAGKGGKPAKAYSDYRKMLEEQKDMDAVLIATPEHQHAYQLIDVVRAGLDCYCEKPMSHSISEGVKIVKAVRKTDRIVQVGMQRRSSPIVRKGKEIMDSGVLGHVHYVRVKWHWNIAKELDNSPLPSALDWKSFCYPARRVKFEPMKYRSWRYFWKFSGGNITDQGTHLMDVVQWYMGKELEPKTPQMAECFGEVYKMKGSETPDVFSSIMQYDGFIASWTLDYCSTYQNSWSVEFLGDKGTMVVDDRGARVYGEPWDPAEDSMLVSKKPPMQAIQGGLGSVEHTKNFLDCVKSRKQPNATVEIGHKAVCGPHLANVAFHRKERAYLNDTATKVNRDLL